MGWGIQSSFYNAVRLVLRLTGHITIVELLHAFFHSGQRPPEKKARGNVLWEKKARMGRAKPRPPCVKGAGGGADWGIAAQRKRLEWQCNAALK